MPEEKLLRRRQVEELVGLSRASIYKKMSEENFPKPVHLPGGGAVRWKLSDVQAWIHEQSKLGEA